MLECKEGTDITCLDTIKWPNSLQNTCRSAGIVFRYKITLIDLWWSFYVTRGQREAMINMKACLLHSHVDAQYGVHTLDHIQIGISVLYKNQI